MDKKTLSADVEKAKEIANALSNARIGQGFPWPNVEVAHEMGRALFSVLANHRALEAATPAQGERAPSSPPPSTELREKLEHATRTAHHIHAACADPTRPRQSIGEMAAHLEQTLAAIATGEATGGWRAIARCSCRRCEAERPGEPHEMVFGHKGPKFIVCVNCGNKRCPHATDHTLGCTGSNEPGQVGSAYA